MKRAHVRFLADLLAQAKAGPIDLILLGQAERLIEAERRNWTRQDEGRAAAWAKRRAARLAERNGGKHG
jgi:hypothetical protein